MAAHLSRRELIEGGAVLSLLALAGCQSTPPAAIPEPVRPVPEPYRPPARPPAPVTRAPVPGSNPPAGPAPNVLARASWTNSGVARPSDINPMLPISRITIHHDGMDAFTSTGQGDAAARLELIRRAHTGQRKFADIGYHYIVDPGGRVWEGRNVRYQGAHVENNNEGNLGVMCLGNFDLHRPSSAQVTSLDRFVASQMKRYNVPVNRVYTHQEINPTACPGRYMQQYLIASRGRTGNLRLALAELDGAETAWSDGRREA